MFDQSLSGRTRLPDNCMGAGFKQDSLAMTDDKLKKMLEDQDRFSRSLMRSSDLERMSEQLRTWREPFGTSDQWRKMLDDVHRQQELFRAALGPAEELRRSLQAYANPPFLQEFSKLAETFGEYEKRFRLPAVKEATRLLQSHQDAFADIARRHREDLTSLQRSIASMQSPWLNTMNELKSLSGFASLQGIGRALKVLPAFDDQLSELLRSDLGDWRDQITFPDRISDDIVLRTDFYTEQGFDPNLTDFPAAAFGESLDIVGLREQPAIVIAYGLPVRASSSASEEDGFRRTNKAHDWLQRMETQLRQFIDRTMTAAHGTDWPRHRLPNGVYDQWMDKRRKAEQGGKQSFRLIAYADFTDYEPIICRRDNWPLFAPIFLRPESVRESFQRLHPIRLCTMHSRVITQDDELLLYVEVRRLIKGIDAATSRG